MLCFSGRFRECIKPGSFHKYTEFESDRSHIRLVGLKEFWKSEKLVRLEKFRKSEKLVRLEKFRKSAKLISMEVYGEM